MLKLYSAPRTRSFRVAWLLEELGIDYELIQGEFQRTGSSFYIQKTPTGKFPTLDDDGFIMIESCAIAEYLMDKYGDQGLRPERGTTQYGEYLQWMYFADATAFAPLGIVVWLSVYRDDAADNQALIKDAVERARSGFQYLEQALKDNRYLLGDQLSAADIMMSFTLMSAEALQILEAFPRLSDYLARLRSLETFGITLEKTGN